MRPSRADTPLSVEPSGPEPGAPVPVTPVRSAGRRPAVHGKFFRVGEEKVYLRGVTYGPFARGPDGDSYDRSRTDDDFARMSEAGINALRLYTAPPDWLLDAASEHGLFVFAGLAWGQHVTFLDEPRRARAIMDRMRGE